MIQIKFDDHGIKRKVSKLREHMSGVAINKAVGVRILALVTNQFIKEGQQFGKKWDPLSPVTIARRRKNSSRILQDTGILKNSFDKFGIKTTTSSFTIGTNDPRAGLHQFGGRIRWGKNYVTIPKRPMLPESDTQIKEVVSNLLSIVLKKAAKDAQG